MSQLPHTRTLPWLEPGQAFPPVENAWGENDPAPGLLAAGGSLDAATLIEAYSQGIFPWFSQGQPHLWWCPDQRMVLQVGEFKLHPSLRKTLRKGLRSTPGNGCIEVRMDTRFGRVIEACARTPRPGQAGTWIVADMISAYQRLHEAGVAHSVETWWDGELVGGLYCINLGRMVFGESMFSLRPDASKVALAGLVAFCRAHQIAMIDCQQNTAHLARLGAHEISRQRFSLHIAQATALPPPRWEFTSVYWQHLLSAPPRDQ